MSTISIIGLGTMATSLAKTALKGGPADAHVVKAFNTVFGNVLTAGAAEGRSLDVFIAGDDALLS